MRGAEVSHHFGGHSERDTPLPIPNRVVKPLCADGTWFARAWESRSPPISFTGPPFRGRPFFLRVSGRFVAAGPLGLRAPSSACPRLRRPATRSGGDSRFPGRLRLRSRSEGVAPAATRRSARRMTGVQAPAVGLCVGVDLICLELRL